MYTDGSEHKVHGIRRAGAGFAVYQQGRETAARNLGLGSQATSFDAELAGLLAGTRNAVNACNLNVDVTHIYIFTDNSAVITTALDPKPTAGQLLAHNFYQTIHSFLDGNASRQVSLRWVPSHVGIEGNTRADHLAKAGAALASSLPMAKTRTFARRAAKERLDRAWVREWKDAPRNGHYAIANRFPPSTRPTPRFLMLGDKREVFGRLTQCRTGHGYTGEFYRRFVPDESSDCPCGEPLQTREHIIRDCARYEAHRDVLRKVSATLSLPEILGTRKGLEALAAFLEKSGAFTKTGRPRIAARSPVVEDEQSDDDDDDEETRRERAEMDRAGGARDDPGG